MIEVSPNAPELFNSLPTPRSARLTGVGKKSLVIICLIFFVGFPSFPLLISIFTEGHARLSTILGLIALMFGLGSIFASVFLFNYWRNRRLMRFGRAISAQIKDTAIGGRVNGVVVSFEHEGKSQEAFIGIGMQEALTLHKGEAFLIVYDPYQPSRANRYPHPDWTVV